MDKPVIILGAKGIAHPALEIFNSNQVIVYGFLDEDAATHGTEINNVPVLGHTEDEGFLKLIGKKTEAFVAVDDSKPRLSIAELDNTDLMDFMRILLDDPFSRCVFVDLLFRIRWLRRS